jgi:hypothetical protein
MKVADNVLELVGSTPHGETDQDNQGCEDNSVGETRVSNTDLYR